MRTGPLGIGLDSVPFAGEGCAASRHDSVAMTMTMTMLTNVFVIVSTISYQFPTAAVAVHSQAGLDLGPDTLSVLLRTNSVIVVMTMALSS